MLKTIIAFLYAAGVAAYTYFVLGKFLTIYYREYYKFLAQVANQAGMTLIQYYWYVGILAVLLIVWGLIVGYDERLFR